MTPQTSKTLLGAVIAAALAFAVYYGLIGQQAANTIQNQANQSLGTAPASQQSTQPTPPNGTAQAPAQNGLPQQNPAPPPRQ